MTVFLCQDEVVRGSMSRAIANRYEPDYDCRFPVGAEEYAAELRRLADDGADVAPVMCTLAPATSTGCTSRRLRGASPPRQAGGSGRLG